MSKSPIRNADVTRITNSSFAGGLAGVFVTSAPSPDPSDIQSRFADSETQEMLRGTFKHGREFSRTRNQRKWLAAEMSAEDRHELADTYDESVTHSGKIVYMSKHLKDKIARGELTVPQDVVEQTLSSFSDSFIEYSVTRQRGRESKRVLLRNYDLKRDVMVKGQVRPANLCIVIDIDTCCMVTAWWCSANWCTPDNARSILNPNRYENLPSRNTPESSTTRSDGCPSSQPRPVGSSRQGTRPQGSATASDGGNPSQGEGTGEKPRRRRRRRRRRRSSSQPASTSQATSAAATANE